MMCDQYVFVRGCLLTLCLHHQVKVLFVRNLASTVTEEILEKAFSQFGKLERVKKLKDYAFIHFEERDGAVKVWTKKSFVTGQTCNTFIMNIKLTLL